MAATHEYVVDLPEDLRRMAAPANVTHALVTIAMPDTLPADIEVPLLIVSATSDHSSRRLAEAYAKVAMERSWIVLAADPSKPVATGKDDSPLRLALDNAALAALRRVRPVTATAPLAFAGFSGGAKYSGWLAAAFAKQGRKVIGVYQSGINEETLSEAARHFGVLDTPFLKTPVFLQSGAKDTVATPDDHRRVAASLRRAGFENVRIETAPGGHEVDATSLREALEWFVAWTTPAVPSRR